MLDLHPLQYVVLVLGVTRITRLVNVDTFGAPVRKVLANVFSKPNAEGKQGELDEWGRAVSYGYELATCPWCLGFWCSVIALLGYAASPAVATWALAPFALNYAVGVLEQTF